MQLKLKGKDKRVIDGKVYRAGETITVPDKTEKKNSENKVEKKKEEVNNAITE